MGGAGEECRLPGTHGSCLHAGVCVFCVQVIEEAEATKNYCSDWQAGLDRDGGPSLAASIPSAMFLWRCQMHCLLVPLTQTRPFGEGNTFNWSPLLWQPFGGPLSLPLHIMFWFSWGICLIPERQLAERIWEETFVSVWVCFFKCLRVSVCVGQIQVDCARTDKVSLLNGHHVVLSGFLRRVRI